MARKKLTQEQIKEVQGGYKPNRNGNYVGEMVRVGDEVWSWNGSDWYKLPYSSGEDVL